MSDPGTMDGREASLADQADLPRMMRALAFEEPAILFDRDALRVTLKMLFDHLDYGQIWILANRIRRAGYAILTLGFRFAYRGRDAFIDEIYIDQPYREAMQLAENRARALAINAVHLAVNRGNQPALALYRRGYLDRDRLLTGSRINKP